MNCELVFNHIVDNVTGYLQRYGLNAMVLGISGGIDSTVMAAICHEVSKRHGYKFIGRSLPIKNSVGEVNVADLVGKALCQDYKECNLSKVFGSVVEGIYHFEDDITMNPIALGNIQARLRMIYLYNLAGVYGGIVMDTDNRSENLLGFWTRHGDEGDIKPIGNLYKTEVYELAEYLVAKYKADGEEEIAKAIKASIEMKPTDGLGISDGDEEQIGAPYSVVDSIFQALFLAPRTIEGNKEVMEKLMETYGKEVVDAVVAHSMSTDYKRESVPTLLLNADGMGTFAEESRKHYQQTVNAADNGVQE